MRTLAAAMCATALLAACAGSRPSSRHRSARAGTAPAASNTCITAEGFGGLGGSANAFDANNDDTTGPAQPTPGAAWYEVTGISRGCVTAYSVRDSATPPLTSRDLLVLVSQGYLPKDAARVVNTDSCAVWQSDALLRAVGARYAKATAVAQDWTVPGSAQIEATASSTC